MAEDNFEETIATIRAKDPRYTRDAYYFVREALDHTQRTMGKGRRLEGKITHVSGQELLDGIRDLALSQFGPMAITVLDEWGIHDCRDFGEIVFNLVEIGLWAKTEQDSRADFQDGYGFDAAFREPFLPPSKRAPSLSLPTSSTNN